MNLILLLVLGLLSRSAIAAETQAATVIVPVADVWSKPLAANEKPSDDLRETQVLFGENVLIHESSGSWARIEAVEQPEFTHHNKWEGYPGWVLKSTLGPPPPMTSHKSLSRDIISYASSFIGTPYLWGGLSKEGVDCSGLIHLAFRQRHYVIPRDSYEQWMKAKPIKRSELKPTDLIFSAKTDNPKIISHVALYAGDGQIIEAPQNGMVVRKISFQEKYGKPLEQVESGDTVGEHVIFFGRFLK